MQKFICFWPRDWSSDAPAKFIVLRFRTMECCQKYLDWLYQYEGLRLTPKVYQKK